MSRALIAAALLLACSGSGNTRAAARAATPAALCLQQPRGPGAHDAALRAWQLRAKTASAPGPWVEAGLSWVRKARAESREALYRNAGACARVALDRRSDDAAALALHGLVLLNGHRFAEARDLAHELLARDPYDAQALGLLSDAQLELGDLDAAIDAAQRLVDVKPDLASYGRAAHLRWLQGDALGAKHLYAQAIAAGKGQRDREPSAWMLVQAGLVFCREGDYAGAEAGFDAALAQLPGYRPALEAKRRLALARDPARDGVRSPCP